MLAKYFKEEVVANLESHIPCLRRQHVTLVRENLANDWSSAVLAHGSQHERFKHESRNTYKDTDFLLLCSSTN